MGSNRHCEGVVRLSFLVTPNVTAHAPRFLTRSRAAVCWAQLEPCGQTRHFDTTSVIYKLSVCQDRGPFMLCKGVDNSSVEHILSDEHSCLCYVEACPSLNWSLGQDDKAVPQGFDGKQRKVASHQGRGTAQ